MRSFAEWELRYPEVDAVASLVSCVELFRFGVVFDDAGSCDGWGASGGGVRGACRREADGSG